jgi:hypothetical protein
MSLADCWADVVSEAFSDGCADDSAGLLAKCGTKDSSLPNCCSTPGAGYAQTQAGDAVSNQSTTPLENPSPEKSHMSPSGSGCPRCEFLELRVNLVCIDDVAVEGGVAALMTVMSDCIAFMRASIATMCPDRVDRCDCIISWLLLRICCFISAFSCRKPTWNS